MLLQGIMRVMGLLGAIISLAMFTSTAQASSSLSAVAATAAHNCSQVAALRHRNPAFRGLSSVQTSKAQRACKSAQPHIARINHWLAPKNQWTLYLNHWKTKCKDLPRSVLRGTRARCYLARLDVHKHVVKLTGINTRLSALLPKAAPWARMLRATVSYRQCLIKYESRTSGLYKAENGGTRYVESPVNSNASGAYQFIDSTWKSRFAAAKRYFKGLLKGNWTHAADAPSEVQDIVAAYSIVADKGVDWTHTECRAIVVNV